MGYRADCTIRIDGQTGSGTAWLEHKDLVFRGPFRVTVPLAQVAEATVRDGALVVRFGTRHAEFQIGDVAAHWAQRINNPPSRVDKLGVKPGLRIALVNLDEPTFRHEIQAAGATILPRPAANTDVIFLGTDSRADLSRIDALARKIQPDGALWVVRRKGHGAVSERDSMAAGKKAGLVDVKVVSFSETHTAEKYVVPKGARKLRPAGKPAGLSRSSPARHTRGSMLSRARN